MPLSYLIREALIAFVMIVPITVLILSPLVTH